MNIRGTIALRACLLLACLCSPAHSSAAEFDVLIQGGTLYDGTGNQPIKADVAIQGDRIAHQRFQ